MAKRKKTPLEGVDSLFLDLDGVVYRGEGAIDHAVQAIKKAGLPAAYLTNNASRTPEQVASQLQGYGLTAVPGDIVTSPQAAMTLLRDVAPAGAPVLVVGGEGLTREVESAGYVVTRSADDNPAAVVQGFSPEVGWSDLAEASFALQRRSDLPWIATNTDWTIPLARGTAPGNGSLVSAVHLAVGRLATFAGKPEPAMFEVAKDRLKVTSPLMIGDRLDTDIAGAYRAGIASALVLTGIDQGKQLIAAAEGERPDFVLSDLRDLHAAYPDVVRSVDADGVQTVEVGKAVVRRKQHVIRVARKGRPIDLLRAGAHCVWDSGLKVFGLDIDPVIYS